MFAGAVVMVCGFALGMLAFMVWLKWPQIHRSIYNGITTAMAGLVVSCAIIGVFIGGLVASRRRAIGRYWQYDKIE